MDAITLLTDDHKRLKKMLAEGEETTERAKKTRTELFERLKDALLSHEQMEEVVLYPALKAHPKARDMALEAFEEHHVVDEILEELGNTPVTDETWAAKFTVARENLEHHMGEEEDEMFPNCRKMFSKEELERMGEKMAEIQMAARQVRGAA
jgi:iron-sulfur cluster repair protein YtfE (RIC family)